MPRESCFRKGFAHSPRRACCGGLALPDRTSFPVCARRRAGRERCSASPTPQEREELEKVRAAAEAAEAEEFEKWRAPRLGGPPEAWRTVAPSGR